MKKIAGLWVLLSALACAAGIGSTAPCTISIAQESPADDVVVDLSGSQPVIYLSLNGVARQVDLTADDLGRLKRERDFCAGSGGPPSLKIRLPQATGRPLSRWVIEDFNGDGRKDSAFVSGNGLSLQLGAAGTGFGAATRVTVGPASHTYASAAAGDINGDGKLDLVVCCSGSSVDSKAVVLLGNGNGTFAAPVEAVPAISFGLTDWNRDGKLDIVALTGSGSITLAAGQGNGTFTVVRSASAPVGRAIALVDATGDGQLDALVLEAQRVLLFPGQADGSFGAYIPTDLFWNQAVTLTAGDFTGDGKVDLAVTHQFGLTELLMGDALLRFTRTGMLASPQFTRAIAADLDDMGGAELLMPGSGTTGLQLVAVNTLGVAPGNSVYGIPALLTDFPSYDPQRSGVTVADFDRDGVQDVAVLAPLTGQGIVQLFSVKGPVAPLSFPAVVNNRVSIVQTQAADVTGDGWPDLVALEAETQSLLVFRNSGDGKLQAPVATPLDAPVRCFVLADFNGDGRLDIAIGMGPSPKIQVRYNNGSGSFATFQNLAVSAIPYRLTAGDLNNDFRPDLAFLPQAPTGNLPAGVILNRIDNQFQPPISLPLKPYGPMGLSGSVGAISTGDFNVDGFLDVILSVPFTADGPVVLFMGDGKGGFRAQANDATFAPNVTDLLVTDVDEDGKLDVLAAHCCGNAVTLLYYGKANGTFGVPHPKPVGGWAARVLLSDVTGDGRPDLIAHSYSGVVVAPFAAAKQLGVSNAASGRVALTPDSIASAYGQNLAVDTVAANGLAEFEIRQTRMSIADSAGKVANAPLFFVSPSQVNFLIPGGLALGPARITLQAPGNVVAFADIDLVKLGPALFPKDVSRLMLGNVIRIKSSGQQLAELPFSEENGIRAVPVDLGPASDTIVLALYATGLRGRNGLGDVKVSIGGVDAQVLYAGAQNQYPGLDQVNVVLPRSLAGRGSVEIVVTVEGQASNAVRIEVR